ncbi:MAG: hypothetical protein DGJ47_000396, partial [Rickettsiaceae bacterium]
SDRFNLGGFNFRGFAQGGIGPRVKQEVDTKDSDGNVVKKFVGGEGLGGQKYYKVTTELSFPLFFTPKEMDLTGSVFLDVGSLWDADTNTGAAFYNTKNIRASVGFGFLWVTRMAPIRVDWGFPIKKDSHDETQMFNIRFTTQL